MRRVTGEQHGAAVDAVSRLLAREVRVIRVLTGGQHATTVVVTDGRRKYVAKVFPASDDAADREAAALSLLAPLDGFVPRLVAHDRSVLVASELPGGAPPPELSAMVIAEQMGAALARIHAVPPTGFRRVVAPPPVGTTAIAVRARKEWSELDRDSLVLTHSDFWCGNALWQGDELTGIVDWSGAHAAPAGVDLAWGRLDLVLLGDTRAARRLVEVYGQRTGRSVGDIARWDVQAAAHAAPIVETWAPNYEGISRPQLTPELLRERFDDWVDTLLADPGSG